MPLPFVGSWLEVRVEKYRIDLPYSIILYRLGNLIRVYYKIVRNMVYAISRLRRQQSHYIRQGGSAGHGIDLFLTFR
jgi:hypothetical protein